MKYFFLADGWTYARVWGVAGLWDGLAWRRKPEIRQLNLGIVEKGQTLWLYSVEDAVLMLEVKPTEQAKDFSTTIKQVIVKRLISADQVLDLLSTTDRIFRNEIT